MGGGVDKNPNGQPVDYHVTPDMARQVAEKRLQLSNPKRFKQVQAVSVTREEIPGIDAGIYVVETDPAGFVIVPDTKKLPPVLGFSESRSFYPENQKPGGLSGEVETWLGYQMERAMVMKDGNAFLDEWDIYLDNHTEAIIDPDDCDTVSHYLEKTVYGHYINSNNTYEGYMTTTWGQCSPYNINSYFDSNNSCGYCVDYPVGCTTVAMAQIVKYWEKAPTNYSWSLMCDHCTQINSSSMEVSRLMADVADEINVSLDCSGSGAFVYFPTPIISDMYDAFQKWGYHVVHSKYNILDSSDRDTFGTVYQDLTQNIMWRRPVVLAGMKDADKGHAWNSDGYWIERWKDVVVCETLDGEQTYIRDSGNGDDYMYMNWGWNGSSNGWYWTTRVVNHLNYGLPFNETFNTVNGNYKYDMVFLFDIF